MLTDKQSLILCICIVLGFVVGGIFDVLDSYVAMGVLTVLIVVLLLNIIIVKSLNGNDK